MAFNLFDDDLGLERGAAAFGSKAMEDFKTLKKTIAERRNKLFQADELKKLGNDDAAAVSAPGGNVPSASLGFESGQKTTTEIRGDEEKAAMEPKMGNDIPPPQGEPWSQELHEIPGHDGDDENMFNAAGYDAQKAWEDADPDTRLAWLHEAGELGDYRLMKWEDIPSNSRLLLTDTLTKQEAMSSANGIGPDEASWDGMDDFARHAWLRAAGIEGLSPSASGLRWTGLERGVQETLKHAPGYGSMAEMQNADTFNVHCDKCDDLTPHTGKQTSTEGDRTCTKCGTHSKFEGGKWVAKNAEPLNRATYYFDSVLDTTGGDHLMQGQVMAFDEAEARRMVEEKAKKSGALGVKSCKIVRANAAPTDEQWEKGEVKCHFCGKPAIGSVSGKPVCDRHADEKRNAGYQMKALCDACAAKLAPGEKPMSMAGAGIDACDACGASKNGKHVAMYRVERKNSKSEDKKMENAGHVGSSEWAAADLNEKAGWLDAAGQDVELARFPWAELGQSVQEALQDVSDMPESENIPGALPEDDDKRGQLVPVEERENSLSTEDMTWLDAASMKLYGKKYRELEDDGTEQDHLIHTLEERKKEKKNATLDEHIEWVRKLILDGAVPSAQKSLIKQKFPDLNDDSIAYLITAAYRRLTEKKNDDGEEVIKDKSDYEADGACVKCGWGAPGTGHTSGYHKEGCAVLKRERAKYEHLQGAERKNVSETGKIWNSKSVVERKRWCLEGEVDRGYAHSEWDTIENSVQTILETVHPTLSNSKNFYTFVDGIGATELVNAVDPMHAWTVLSHRLGASILDIQNSGIRLHNANVECDECGELISGEPKKYKGGNYCAECLHDVKYAEANEFNSKENGFEYSPAMEAAMAKVDKLKDEEKKAGGRKDGSDASNKVLAALKELRELQKKEMGDSGLHNDGEDEKEVERHVEGIEHEVKEMLDAAGAPGHGKDELAKVADDLKKVADIGDEVEVQYLGLENNKGLEKGGAKYGSPKK